jgi:hypothetical protein
MMTGAVVEPVSIPTALFCNRNTRLAFYGREITSAWLEKFDPCEFFADMP